MRHFERGSAWLRSIRIHPLSLSRLSVKMRVLVVALSYGLGILGLCAFFPSTQNGASMFLPLMSACWLFRYRGLLSSMVLNGIAFQLVYLFLLRGMLPDSSFVVGGLVGFVSSLGLCLLVCWLRATVDRVQEAQQQTLASEQKRLQAVQAERMAQLALERRRLNDLQDLFLLHVNHELRTPLTVLGGFLALLEANHEQLNATERANLLKHALLSQEELAHQLNGISDTIAVNEAIPLARPEPVSVTQLVQEVVAELTPEKRGYGIHLHMPKRVVIRTDPRYLRQILRHLLSNVFKYVPTQTDICIEVSQPDPASLIYLSVQDAGPGIPAEELPLLFEKFVRLKRDIAGPTRGLGLGLYICRRLIQAMGGCIWVESSGDEGEGCRFCLALPLFPSSLPPSEEDFDIIPINFQRRFPLIAVG